MNEKKIVFINIFLLIVIAILAIFQVVILNLHSTMGGKLVSFGQEIANTEKENGRLSQKIASASALATIANKAKQSGFANNQTVISLYTQLPLAFFQKSSL